LPVVDKVAPESSPVAEIFPVPILPLTDRAVNVPRLVMFVCAAVVNEPEIFDAVRVSVSLSNVNVESAPKSPSSLKIT
jgi:hypothetical protein